MNSITVIDWGNPSLFIIAQLAGLAFVAWLLFTVSRLLVETAKEKAEAAREGWRSHRWGAAGSNAGAAVFNLAAGWFAAGGVAVAGLGLAGVDTLQPLGWMLSGLAILALAAFTKTKKMGGA